MKNTAAVLLLTLALPAPGLCSGPVRHDISMSISPGDGSFRAEDRVTLPAPAASFEFDLHAGLAPASPEGYGLENISPSSATGGVAMNGEPGGAPIERFRLSLPPGASSFRLAYGGPISHDLREQAQEYARSFSETAGIISSSGCYLSGASGFYPRHGGGPVSYSLEVSLPDGWTAVSGGVRTFSGRRNGRSVSAWREDAPQDDITLVCGRFTEYSMEKDGTAYQAFLRAPDPGLARKYMETAASYASMYSRLIGPYPYAKFALVENFWETGYGMPSFTLLGPKVIRLPFILHSSYPHEILHNWWGNGVFVDYRRGNWCEGLTAYLADHLIAEGRGKGRDYRMAALQKYSDYVRDGADFPLTDFRSRHSSASEAVGYGKSLMMYHMLRLRLGDEGFLAGLREFYGANRFRTADFADLRAAFEKTSGDDLSAFFAQWTERAGAPEIRLTDAGPCPEREGADPWRLDLDLEQSVSHGAPYDIDVPVYITLAGEKEARLETVRLSSGTGSYTLVLPTRALAVEIDPGFDLFRKVSPEETPASLSRILGAAAPLILLPSDGEKWKDLTAWWDRDPSNRPEIRRWRPGDPGSSPAGPGQHSPRPAWILASSETEAPVPDILTGLGTYGLKLGTGTIRLGGEEFALDSHTFVLAGTGPSPSALILSRPGQGLARLAAKLPHYGKYSWLVFDREMNAVRTGVWKPAGSPLVKLLVQGAETAPVPARAALGGPDPLFSPAGMRKTAEALAGLPGGRGPGSPGLAEAARLIAGEFEALGLKPFKGRTFLMRERSDGRRLVNIAGLVRGATLPDEMVIVAAHYDHLAPDDGDVLPGANDNASGVAMLLELARHYAAAPPERSVLFVAFDGEEDGRLGSRAFIKRLGTRRLSRTNAAVNLDTVGKMTAGGPLILGASSSDKWPHILRGASFVTGLPHRVVKEELDSSDQVSFIEAGVPAVQVFGGPDPDYHKPTDNADRLDYAAMSRAADLVREMTDYLAGAAPFITRPTGVPAAAGRAAGTRKVSTGLVPDFAYQGEGVRAADITPGSPLAAAGVTPGETVKAVNGKPVKGLRDYSAAISSFRPGDAAVFTIQGGTGLRDIRIEFSER